MNSHSAPGAVSSILLTLPYAFKGLSWEWYTLGKITWKPHQGKLLHQLPTLIPTLHTSSSFVIFSSDISTTDMLAKSGDTGKALLSV